ncbi:MAG: nucleoside-diphosphate sugar epimerase [Desulfobulbaceae bacterium]|nr:nucleoside-diphosphate sugar epimerase [Desulfobulbaceae bacterium]
MMMEGQQSEDASGPLVWLLVDDRPGNTTQSQGLVQALGWSYATKQLHFTGLAKLRNHWLRTYGANLLGLDTKCSATLSPPWPDLVITAGLRTAPIARWIKKQSGGKTVTIQIGRKGGHVADLFDAVVTCGYAQFPPHPQRIETTIPLTRVTSQSLDEARHEWKELFRGSPHPRIALLVGGSTARHRFDASAARHLGEELSALAEVAGGSIFAITSRRTGAEAEKALQTSLGSYRYFHGWASSNSGNPYLAYLGSADVIVVTGESESMLAEAAVSGKPVYIYELPETPLPRTARLGNWIAKRARKNHDMPGRSGGIASLFNRCCSLLIAKGLIRPPRDLRRLHETLIRSGIAHRFGEPLTLQSPPPLREMEVVVNRVKTLVQQR